LAGSERALTFFLDILRSWVSIERWFCDGISYADAVDNLRKANKDEYDAVLCICRSHSYLEGTSMLVKNIMTAIEEGSSVNDSLTGAEGLSVAEPCLTEIGAMGGNVSYSSVALMARKLLLKESLPSIATRQEKVSNVAQIILKESDSSGDLKKFMDENVPMADIIFPLLKGSTSTDSQLALIEIYARNLYQKHATKEISHANDEKLVKVEFTTKSSESVFSSSTSLTSMTDLTRLVSSSSMRSLSDVGGESDSELSTSNSLFMHKSTKIPPNTMRTAAFKVVDNLEEISGTETFDKLLQAFPQYKNSEAKCQAGPINLLHIYVTNEGLENSQESMNIFAKRCEDLLSGLQNLLTQADIRRVTFNVDYASSDEAEEYPSPAIFTFRARGDFCEDALFRHIEPSQAYHLDLLRVAKNFSVSSLSSSQSSSSHVHLYRATPKRTALVKDKKANPAARTFVRAVSFIEEFSSVSFEKIFVHALNALDLSSTENSSVHPNGDNHLFINLVNDENVVLDAADVKQGVVAVLKRHGSRLKRLGLAEVETRITCCLSEDSPPISIRMVASNPTGYVFVMDTYVEVADETNTKNIFRLIGETKSSMSSSGDSSWEGKDVTTPYPLTRPFDTQRKAAIRSSDTLYCYDLPALFEAAAEQQWDDSAQVGIESGNAPTRPLMVMYTSELVVQRKSGSGPWTMGDYINGDLEMVQVQRGAGANDVGMVAWLMILKTKEYPEVSSKFFSHIKYPIEV